MFPLQKLKGSKHILSLRLVLRYWVFGILQILPWGHHPSSALDYPAIDIHPSG
jgi:hypothetical protein